ncbi:MAG: HAD-IIIA family hydrolase [Mariprofundus sp.]|nr:HAD-IIIA family hydrolase [Mariprofundus sp.]
MSSEPALILFDCDGTLTDSHNIIVQAMQHAFQDAGLKTPAKHAVCAVIGLSLTKAICALMDDAQKTDSALHQQITQQYRHHYLKLEQQVTLFPHVLEGLQTLSASGYWLGVVTGKSHSGLLRVLDSFALRDMFYVLRTADCTHSKPHPAMVLECMQELGVAAENTCVIGDAVFDIQMAKSAGVRALGVSFGVASTDELLQAGAYDVVDRFTDLLGYFPTLQDRPPSPTIADEKQY